MEVPEVILYMDYNMTLACYPRSLLIYYLLTSHALLNKYGHRIIIMAITISSLKDNV